MKNPSAHLSLLISNAIWACAYPLYNFVMPTYIKPLPLFTATVAVTALLSLLSLPFDGGRRAHQIERRDIMAVVGATLLIAVLRKGMLLFSLSLTSPVDASIIATVAPVVVLVISVVVGLERFSRRKLLGVLLGFGGAVGVILSGNAGQHSNSGLVGNLLVLMCAFIAAIYMVWFKSLLKRYEPMVLLRWMFCISALVVLPFGAKSLWGVDTHGWDLKVWLAVVYLVVMPTYPPNLLLTSALKRVTPTVSSIYTYLQPTLAVAISVIAGLDKLRPQTVLFAVAIFVGVGVVISTGRGGKGV